jgi:hypothetical protein
MDWDHFSCTPNDLPTSLFAGTTQVTTENAVSPSGSQTCKLSWTNNSGPCSMTLSGLITETTLPQTTQATGTNVVVSGASLTLASVTLTAAGEGLSGELVTQAASGNPPGTFAATADTGPDTYKS